MLKSVHLVHEHDYDENKSKSGEYFEVSSLYPIGEKTSSKTLCIKLGVNDDFNIKHALLESHENLL